MTITGPSTSDDEAAAGQRRCGRCRALFPTDDTLHDTGSPTWWLCDVCHDILITRRTS